MNNLRFGNLLTTVLTTISLLVPVTPIHASSFSAKLMTHSKFRLRLQQSEELACRGLKVWCDGGGKPLNWRNVQGFTRTFKDGRFRYQYLLKWCAYQSKFRLIKSQELHNEGAILIGKMQNQLADLAILDTVPLNVVKSIVHYREQTTRTRFVNLQIKTFLPAQNCKCTVTPTHSY